MTSNKPKAAEPGALDPLKSINEPSAPGHVELGGSINEPVTKEDLPEVPPPVIDSIAPDTEIVGNPDVIATITGSGFLEASKAFVNDGELETVFVSDTELTALFTISGATEPGSWPITVRHGNQTSNAVNFTLEAAPPPEEDESEHDDDDDESDDDGEPENKVHRGKPTKTMPGKRRHK